jgi:CspA family cold shock protein
MFKKGKVKYYDPARGYGFIRPDDCGRDVFVHSTAVIRAGLESLSAGQLVSYVVEPERRGKGPKAIEVMPSDRI